MMFVSGETGDVSPETTSMIEGIVQQQVMEMVCQAASTTFGDLRGLTLLTAQARDGIGRPTWCSHDQHG